MITLAKAKQWATEQGATGTLEHIREPYGNDYEMIVIEVDTDQSWLVYARRDGSIGGHAIRPTPNI